MKIDINCDLGEGIGNDELLMPFLGSCNIACGGHFGDEVSMKTAVKLAIKHGVSVGAHPSYPDKENFGRKIMDINFDTLMQSVYQQVTAFQNVCKELNTTMHHIKLHGALYNLAAKDAEFAGALLNVFAACQTDIKIYVPYNSIIAYFADDYLPVAFEAFADRSYNDDLSLVNRDQDNALIIDKKLAWKQIESIIETGQVKTITNKMVKIKADTFCVHGDSKNAYEILKYIYQCLNR